MSVEGETCAEILEQKVTTLSPSMQSDLSTDGDVSTNLNNSSSNDKFSQISTNSQAVSSEPKAKKRRKQSNPLKIQNDTFPKFDLSYELSEQSEGESNAVTPYFVNEELLNQNHDTEKSKVSDLSQKGSLSKVTNALYNKIKEAAKANKAANKSKESSLSSCQSITDISSPDSSEELATNNEYKHSLQNPYSQMPPLLPMNPVEVGDPGKMSVPYPFSEFPSTIPQGNSLSITHRSFITSSGVRVFNPEAYCELCEKEFCNKYFLKTHKANKHGICSVDAYNSPSHSYRQYKSVPVTPQSTQQMINQVCENGAMFGSADSYCNICQKYFCNKYFLKKHRQNIHGIHDSQEMTSNTPSSIHVPVISSPLPLVRPTILESKSVDNSGLTTKDEDSKINVSLENIKNSLNSSISQLNGSSPHSSSQNKSNVSTSDTKEKKNDKYLCELCNIEFCDKCYLDAHKRNKHGLQTCSITELPDEGSEMNEKSNSPIDGDDSKDYKEQMCAPCMKTFTTVEAFQTHMLEVHIASMKDEDDFTRMSDILSKKTLLNNFDKDLSNQDKSPADKSPAMQEVENSNSSNELGSFNCILCFIKCKDRNSFITHMETEHNIGLVGSDPGQDGVFSCDACTEQFTDRLTLITHKFKMHGITTPGLEEYMENGDLAYTSGKQKSNSSFCTICNKELCNKYFMKTHMLKMHGIGMDKVQQQERFSTPTGSASTGVYCDICQKLLCSKYFLKVHKQNVHGIVDDSLKLPTPGSQMYNNGSGVNMKKMEKHYPNVGKLNNVVANDTIMGKEDPVKGKIFSCDLCGQEFSNKLSLQVHLVDKHVKCNDSKVSSKALSNSYSQLHEEARDTTRILPCSCCLLVNLGDNLQAEIGQELKLISCIVCNITYQQSDYHAHHLSHGANPSSKKLKLENGDHEPGLDFSGNNSFDPNGKNKTRPRKFKRFRCSKCDKTFRTKIKCLHHIQVMHKTRKGVLNQCEQQTPPKKAALNHILSKKNSDVKHSSGTENGSALISDKDAKNAASILSSGFHEGGTLPVPYVLPKNSDVIMQPFHLSEPKPDGATKQDVFVPSLVYLPVSQKVSEPVTVAFTLTPA